MTALRPFLSSLIWTYPPAEHLSKRIDKAFNRWSELNGSKKLLCKVKEQMDFV